uniref:Uncharacterized protein n=1 Tax=Scleropages formosus TaxID=113540 RepID=A0A8C9VM09_SCLFO
MLSFLQPPSHCRTKSKWQKSKSAEIQSTSSLMKVKYGAEGGKNQEFCKIYVFSVFLAKGGITYRFHCWSIHRTHEYHITLDHAENHRAVETITAYQWCCD